MSDCDGGDGCLTFVVFIVLVMLCVGLISWTRRIEAKLDTLVDHSCVSEEGPVQPEWVKELRK